MHLITKILPEYEKTRLDYVISPYDGHPNALAHRLIAEYIIKNIVESRIAVQSIND